MPALLGRRSPAAADTQDPDPRRQPRDPPRRVQRLRVGGAAPRGDRRGGREGRAGGAGRGGTCAQAARPTRGARAPRLNEPGLPAPAAT